MEAVGNRVRTRRPVGGRLVQTAYWAEQLSVAGVVVPSRDGPLNPQIHGGQQPRHGAELESALCVAVVGVVELVELVSAVLTVPRSPMKVIAVMNLVMVVLWLVSTTHGPQRITESQDFSARPTKAVIGASF